MYKLIQTYNMYVVATCLDATCQLILTLCWLLFVDFRTKQQLKRKIMMEVQHALPIGLFPKILIGLKKPMEDVLNTLESVSVVGLVGTVGIGKTTLAMELYNFLLSYGYFSHYCFLSDVQSNQTSMLKEKVLRDLGVGYMSHCSDEEYRDILNHVFNYQRVLIIVDDISDAKQFEALFPEIHMILGLKCRIVITSRQHDVLKHVMNALPATSKAVYEVQLLNKFDSQRLFNNCAFMSETPMEGFVELATTIADACHGHPLLLQLMGCHLFDKETPEEKVIWLELVKMVQNNNTWLEVRLLCLKLCIGVFLDI